MKLAPQRPYVAKKRLVRFAPLPFAISSQVANAVCYAAIREKFSVDLHGSTPATGSSAAVGLGGIIPTTRIPLLEFLDWQPLIFCQTYYGDRPRSDLMDSMERVKREKFDST